MSIRHSSPRGRSALPCSSLARNATYTRRSVGFAPGVRNTHDRSVRCECTSAAHRTVAVVHVFRVRSVSPVVAFRNGVARGTDGWDGCKGFERHLVRVHGMAPCRMHRLRSAGAARVTITRASPPELGSGRSRWICGEIKLRREAKAGCRDQTTWCPGIGARSSTHRAIHSTNGAGTIGAVALSIALVSCESRCRYRGRNSGELRPCRQYYACNRQIANDGHRPEGEIRARPPSPRPNALNLNFARIQFDDTSTAIVNSGQPVQSP